MIGDRLGQARVMAHFYREALGALDAYPLLPAPSGYRRATRRSLPAMLQSENSVMASALMAAIAAASNAGVTLGALGMGAS